VAQQFGILFEIYRRPHAAFCRVLDEGKFLFALIAALIAAVLLFGPVFETGVAALLQVFAPGAVDAAPKGVPSAIVLATRMLRGFSTLGGLILLSLLYVPATIAVVTLWDSLGGVATILRRDYLPLLTCHLLSYVAVLVPCALLRSVLAVPVVYLLPLLAIFAAYFLFLSATSLRAVMGTTTAHAAITTVAGCGAAMLGGVLYGFIGSGAYILTSPFLLYYGYRFFQSDIQLIGSGLSSRQNLRRQLEISKLNPRDWDAHLQIGLIQAQRRQFAEAEASFKKAIEIAPDEADAYFHLAKIMREQGRLEEAMKALRTAASLDEKLSSSEVWRDLGAVAFLADHPEEAQPALAKYVQRRPYDPEGLYWYGKVLKKLGQPAAAKEALEQSLEAAQTAPSHQRGRLRKWATEAKAELKSL
jgi:Tfp pilus assembly protein PilF